ncbi:MAG: asparaginase, partial [Deltaproteobacteria bacterium]
MSEPVVMAELWRNGFLESVHTGHAVICGPGGDVEQVWGEADQPIFPRSSCKMLQALPLVESGAADHFRLGSEQLALACASHSGAEIHTSRVTDWLAAIGKSESDLRCGSHEPYDNDRRREMIRASETPCQIHNNCSGKHSGFVTLNAHLQGHADYIEVDHPVQMAVRSAFEEVTEEASPGYG